MARTSICHPDKKHKGHGLCVSCYGREAARGKRDANRARSKEWYWANRETAIAAAVEWARRNQGKHRATVLKYRYGLTPEDEVRMLVAQDFRCAICMEPFDGSRRVTKVAVDHDHKTGKVRGLLHVRCNTALGMLHDNPGWLRRAAEYLEASR